MFYTTSLNLTKELSSIFKINKIGGLTVLETACAARIFLSLRYPGLPFIALPR